jgi:hypothetical protein
MVSTCLEEIKKMSSGPCYSLAVWYLSEKFGNWFLKKYINKRLKLTLLNIIEGKFVKIVIDTAKPIMYNYRQIQSSLSLWRNYYEVYESNELCFAYNGLFR